MEYMQYDRELILNILDRVYNSIEQIEKRSENYHCGDDFLQWKKKYNQGARLKFFSLFLCPFVFIWNFAARYKWFALWQQEWWRKQSPGYFLTKLKANVKKVVEKFG